MFSGDQMRHIEMNTLTISKKLILFDFKFHSLITRKKENEIVVMKRRIGRLKNGSFRVHENTTTSCTSMNSNEVFMLNITSVLSSMQYCWTSKKYS